MNSYIFCERNQTMVETSVCHIKVLNTKVDSDLLVCRQCQYGIQLANSLHWKNTCLIKKSFDTLTLHDFYIVLNRYIETNIKTVKNIQMNSLVNLAKIKFHHSFEEKQFEVMVKRYKLNYSCAGKKFTLKLDKNLKSFLVKCKKTGQ